MGDGYGIHGTNDPSSIGRSVSHGCVRLRNEDIATLYDMVEVGTPVYIY
jgi:lipoprotein-anchoring transpeptidase ErfK/SrfK